MHSRLDREQRPPGPAPVLEGRDHRIGIGGPDRGQFVPFAQGERGGQFSKGKSADTFAPVGPHFVSADQIKDIQALSIWSEVNGEMRQQGSTADMVFGVREIVSHLSQFMTLYPGDIIFTGTPAGVGDGMDPPQYLTPGDVVRIGVEGLGEQRQVIAPPR